MPNLYGVSNPVAYKVSGSLATNTVCNAGADTVIITTPNLVASSSGLYYPLCLCNLTITCGATAATFISVNFYIGGGSTFFNPAWPVPLLANNATSSMFYAAAGPYSEVPWQGAGSPIRVSINPQAQNVTALQIACYCLVELVRGPDA